MHLLVSDDKIKKLLWRRNLLIKSDGIPSFLYILHEAPSSMAAVGGLTLMLNTFSQ